MVFKRRTLFIGAILFFSIAVFIIFGYFSLHRSVPPESGEFVLPGLQRSVEVGRDQWGVPHIAAENELDLFFAAGYSSAQDRLWEMDVFRRAAQGRLAEILGPELIPVDIFSRTIGYGRLGRQLLTNLPSETAANLKAYSAGVNAYISSAKQLPLEFGVLHYQPEPWKPEESLAIMRLIGWLLSMGWNIDLCYTEMAARVDSVKLSAILPEALPGKRSTPPVAEGDSTAAAPPRRRSPFKHRFPAIPLLPGLDSSRSIPPPRWPGRFTPDSLAQINTALRQGEEQLRFLFNSPTGGLGSNAWVVNGRLTEKGQALLANDTHLMFTVPSVYYLMHFKTPQINAVGAAFPGLPGFVLGRNEQIAWGITNGMMDDIDFIYLEPDQADSGYYWFGKQRYAFVYYNERIAVRGGDEEQVRIVWSHLGPVISAETPILHYRGQTPLVLRWTGFEVDDPLTAFQQLLRARDWRDFLAALEQSKNPGENFFYADRAGQIGHKLAAAVPRRTTADVIIPQRSRQTHIDSLVLADSLQQGYRQPNWLGWVPFSHLPQSFQPAANWIANANNCLVDTSYADYLSSYWEPDFRWQRIKAAMDTTARWNVQACKELQGDLYSGHAAFFTPYLLQAIRTLDLPKNMPADFGRELLSVWDYQQSASSVANTVYEMTLLEFMRLTFADELGDELYQRFMQLSHVNIRALDRLISCKDSLWFDDIRTPQPESMADQLIAAFYGAIDSLTARYGENPGMWNWGDVHTLTQPHPFGLHGPFRRYFNIGPVPSTGGNHTLNNSTYNMAKPFATIIGPCVRLVADMSTYEWHVILPAGQSGHPFSPHYRDQHALWREGRMITLTLRDAGYRHPGWNWQLLRPVSAIGPP